ncbi:hypothetical protein [Bacillus salacetis]|nr:hypothetical protein [Bacillus salacetis]
MTSFTVLRLSSIIGGVDLRRINAFFVKIMGLTGSIPFKKEVDGMEYWYLAENPSERIYRRLITVLCDNSDKFYFVTRKELKYNQEVIAKFNPYIIESYETKKWANTITKGPAATVYVIEPNKETCKLLKEYANNLYEWVAPSLPEDLTFIKNNFAWFSSTTHEEFGSFSIRSDYYRSLVRGIYGLKVQKVE